VKTSDSTSPKLVIIEGKDKGKVIAIEPGTTVFGRTKGDVILQDPRVSRSHVALNYDARSGKLSYTDLKSLNGTLVNGNLVETGVLVDGDRLQIGNTLFDCQLSPATEIAERPEAPLSSINENPEEPLQQPLVEHKIPAFVEEPAEASKSQSLFMAFSPSTRRRFLVSGLVLGLLYFALPGPRRERSGDFDREVTSVHQLERDGKIDEAILKAESLSKEFSREAELQLTLGSLYALQKRYEPALVAYRKAKELQPENPIATVRLVLINLRAGLGKEAEKQMQDLDAFMRDGVRNREFFVEAANLFLEFRSLTQSPEKALILSRALQNDVASDSTIGYKLEAQLLFQQNQNEEALKIIEKGMKRDPQDEWLFENLAFAKLSLKDTAGATETIENWIQAHPKTTKAYLVLAYLKYNDKNYLGALPPLQKIVQIGHERAGDPHVGEALNLMGQIYTQQGQSAEAKNLFIEACSNGFAGACVTDSEEPKK
jgi:tetratricopeptide (TPR) repeat protein